jgi:hypothetical protein
MSTLRTLKKLLLGETWIVPLGLALTLAAAAALGSIETWLGGTVLVVGVLAVALGSVSRTSRRR